VWRSDRTETRKDTEFCDRYTGLGLARQFEEPMVADKRPRNDFRAGTDIVRVPNRRRRSGVCLVANLFGENRSLESVFGEQDCAGEPGDPRANHSDTWLH